MSTAANTPRKIKAFQPKPVTGAFATARTAAASSMSTSKTVSTRLYKNLYRYVEAGSEMCGFQR